MKLQEVFEIIENHCKWIFKNRCFVIVALMTQLPKLFDIDSLVTEIRSHVLVFLSTNIHLLWLTNHQLFRAHIPGGHTLL